MASAPQPGRHVPERRPSPISAGMQWATAITTIGLEMALPPLFGAWLDSRYGTGPLWTVLLAVLGFVVAMRHLWDLSKRLGRRDGRPPASMSDDRKKIS